MSERKKRSKQTIETKRPIRRMIGDGTGPLPTVFEGFLALGDNKAELVKVLSQKLLASRSLLNVHQEVVVSGGLNEAVSTRTRAAVHLTCNHEEADTRIILHCSDAIHEDFSRIIVICRDTDIKLLLLHFFRRSRKSISMHAGLVKREQGIPHTYHWKGVRT